MPTEAVERAKRLVEAAKKRKVEGLLGDLQDQLDDKRAELKLSNQKLGAVQAELSRQRSEKAEVERNLSELQQLKEHLSQEEYDEALSALSSAINDYEKNIAESQARLDSVTMAINQLEAQIGMYLDKKNSLKVKGTSIPSPSSVGEQLMAEACRVELRDLYHQVLSLKQYVIQIRADDPWSSPVRPDSDWSRAMIRNACMIIVGKLKGLAESCQFNDQEQVILRRCLGRVGATTKETFCGSVESLKMSAKEDWTKYVQKAVEERCRLEHQAAAEKARQAKRNAPKEEEPSNPDHEKAIEFVVGSGLLDRTRDRRIGIVGGNPGRNEKARRWLEEALQAKEVLWYEEKDVSNMARSITAKSLDAVVVMANWIGHDSWGIVKDAADKSEVPLAPCRHSNRKMLIEELAEAFGLKK